MIGTVESLVAEALTLPPDQRLSLAHRILNSVEPAVSAEVDEAWDREIRNRIARYDAGTVKTIPAAEIFGEADRHLGHRRPEDWKCRVKAE